MAPQQIDVKCQANKELVNGLKSVADGYQETKKERLASTVRRAIRSIIEFSQVDELMGSCPTPIRSKEDALKLKGIGDFMAHKIENILQKENLLNTEPC